MVKKYNKLLLIITIMYTFTSGANWFDFLDKPLPRPSSLEDIESGHTLSYLMRDAINTLATELHPSDTIKLGDFTVADNRMITEILASLSLAYLNTDEADNTVSLKGLGKEFTTTFVTEAVIRGLVKIGNVTGIDEKAEKLYVSTGLKAKVEDSNFLKQATSGLKYGGRVALAKGLSSLGNKGLDWCKNPKS